MRSILFKIKRKIKDKLRKLVGIDDLERRVTRLEDITTNVEIGVQVDNGLRYLEHIRSVSFVRDNEKQEES